MSSENKNNVAKNDEDITGRDRMAWNVVVSWIGQIVVIIAGFIMPRLIDGYQGQSVLGVWDFCWSLVVYLRLSGIGIGASVNRYVAKFRAEGDIDAMRGIVSSVLVIQLIIATIVVIASIVLSQKLPAFLGESLEGFAGEAQWVILLLGLSVAANLAFDSFRGVMTGYHRWDIHNAIIAGNQVATLALMTLVLINGGGLVELSIAYLSVAVLTELVRVYFAFRVSPELKLRLAYVNLKQTKKIFVFGGKTVILGMVGILIMQTASFFIVMKLGAAALAIYARPVAIMQNVFTLIRKYAFILTPTVSAILGKKDDAVLRQFFLDSGRYSVVFTLPVVLFLVVFGDYLLMLWMGPNYANWTLMAILAVGFFLPISQSGCVQILVGLNAHGKIAIISLVLATVTFITGLLILENIGWSLINAAILVAVTHTLSSGIIVPFYACRRLNVPLLEYLKHAFVLPALCCGVFAGILIATRFLMLDQPNWAMLVGASVGGGVLLMLYWALIIPLSFKKKITKKFRKKA